MNNGMNYLVREGEVRTMEGAQPPYNIRVTSKSGATPTITNDATLTMFVYKNGSDATSTFTTGSMSVSGDVITTKTFTGLIGGDQLHVTIFATVDGIFDCVAEFPLIVRRKSGR
jgi:hypothetical protein